MIGKINILGEIGSYIDEAGTLHDGVTLLKVVEQVQSLPKDVSVISVDIASPGGFVDVGDDIYNYLIDLKKLGKKIITNQKGLIGSIATKPFLAGDERNVDDRYDFWIHNPFQQNVSGDQDVLRAAADSVGETEKNLRKFYAEYTQIGEVALDALMKQETGLTADQCLKFGFATGKVAVPAFNTVKTKINNKMASTKDEKSFMEHVKAFFAPENKKGVAPKTKAEIPGGAEPKNLVVMLAEGAGSFWVEGQEVAVGAPAFLLDDAGQPTAEPLADGDYTLEDGTMVSVAGGLVATLTPPAAASTEEAPLTAEKVAEMINAAMADAKANSLAEIAKVKDEAKAETESKIMALKGSLKLGIQPTKGVLNGSGQKLEYKTINQKMAEKAAERKQQLNKN